MFIKEPITCIIDSTFPVKMRNPYTYNTKKRIVHVRLTVLILPRRCRVYNMQYLLEVA